jgi:UDP-N-acetylglucosamine 1-carboxyvinyltransferase
MSTYQITWGALTAGEITTSGSKNAALPLIASTLFFDHAELHNVPDISDIHLMIEIMESMGSIVKFEDHIFTIDNTNLSLTNLKTALFKKARATYYFIPPLLARFGEVSLLYPGWCSIGKRPIDWIIEGLGALGFKSAGEGEELSFKWTTTDKDVSVNAAFSVGTTIVMLLSALSRNWTTQIELAAYEPHVMNLIDVLRSVWAQIALRYDHTIIIKPSTLSKTLQGTVISDYIVSGTLAVIGALTAKEYIDIHKARIEDLTAFLHVIKWMGVRFEQLEGDTLRVWRSRNLKPTKLQTNIYPGFPTDLQSPTAILMTQAEWVSRIHEVLFEGRLNWLVELEMMRGHIALMNPHEAMVFGRTALRAARVSSWDLRSWAAMLVAGMIASGITELDNVSHIERGYEDFVENLNSIGAKIVKEADKN